MRRLLFGQADRMDRQQTLFDACTARLAAAIDAARANDIAVRWRDDIEMLGMWQRTRGAPMRDALHRNEVLAISPSGHILAVSCYGVGIVQRVLNLNRAVLAHSGLTQPQPLLTLATTIERAVDDILRNRGGVGAYTVYVEHHKGKVRRASEYLEPSASLAT